eukprot:TRINITY_DN39604_c0_g1_i1.p1 TRINITY_DN39604_c0_g1~~TRINITY_DN39604_c0_g1_i1.p1  ORF type:complete len:123 (+),score=26.83 TRINITY_DN39604_c0_g1_i1:132-500(+)
MIRRPPRSTQGVSSAASDVYKRQEPDAEVILIDREKFISYGGCGIPYYVSGDVSDSSDLMKTSFHMVRDEYFFTNCKDVKAVSYTHLRAHETSLHLVCRLLLEKKKKNYSFLTLRQVKYISC